MPAKRFLYLRFAITYLIYRRHGDVDWVNKALLKGKMWASTGSYVRAGTMRHVARVISDYQLPESLWAHTLFDTQQGSATRADDEEEAIARSFSQSALEVMGKKSSEDTGEGTDEDDSVFQLDSKTGTEDEDEEPSTGSDL